MSETCSEYLKIDGISKQYDVVKALNKVSFSICKGEIHAVLGENGAGKSTLVKIIMGEQIPDCGSITLNNKVIKEYTPYAARNMGIQMVHQELALFENMSVAENIFPWHEFRTKAGLVDWKAIHRETQKKLDMFNLCTIKPEQPLNTVTLAGQQMVEILRCIAANPGVIILDEPTSGLNDTEASKLIETLKQLRDEGHTIIYISHRLKEIVRLADRVTILRDGQYVCTLKNDLNMTEDLLINNMVGRDLSGSLYNQKEYTQNPNAEIIFEVKNLSKKNALHPTSFSLKKGEILGFFGLEGSGAERLSRMIYGIESKDFGEIFFKGKKIAEVTPTSMVQNKIMYLNNNRKQAGLLLDMSVTDNVSMPVLKEFSLFSFINFKALADLTEKFINMFSVSIPSFFTNPRNLSGGNQQKIMLSICLAPEPELIIINEPTRGIDVCAKAEIHKFILGIVQSGVSVIIFSSELPELISLADRIIILSNHAVSGEVSSRSEINEQSIMMFATANQKTQGGC